MYSGFIASHNSTLFPFSDILPPTKPSSLTQVSTMASGQVPCSHLFLPVIDVIV